MTANLIQAEELNLVRAGEQDVAPPYENGRFVAPFGNDGNVAAVASSQTRSTAHANGGDRILLPPQHCDSFATRCHELYIVGRLALPTVVIQMGTVLPGFLTASHIGRNFSVEYLDGFTLASLSINLFTLSLLQGLYSASDTLSPQAFGAGNKAELGHLAVRGFLGSLLVTLPSYIVLASLMKPGLMYIGIDAAASTHAYHWYLVSGICLPFNALFQVTWKFLSAQNVMMPLVVCTTLSCSVVLPLSLWTLGAAHGFLGTAMANVLSQIFLATSLLCYLYVLKPHDAQTWPGLAVSLKKAAQWKPFCTYMKLGMGGMLASSEWIYWEALSLVIGTFGVVPLSVHTIPTQVVTVIFMLPLSLGISLSIRLGSTLPVSVPLAKQVVWDCLVIGTVLFAVISVLMYTQRHDIFSLFTNSELVLAGCEEIWWKVCVYTFVLCLFGILMGICVGLGMQWKLGVTAIVFLWVVALPAAYVVSVIYHGGLNATWSTIWPPYIGINLCLAVAIVQADWEEIASDIRIREGVELVKHVPLLPAVSSDTNGGGNGDRDAAPGATQPLLTNFYGSVA